MEPFPERTLIFATTPLGPLFHEEVTVIATVILRTSLANLSYSTGKFSIHPSPSSYAHFAVVILCERPGCTWNVTHQNTRDINPNIRISSPSPFPIHFEALLSFHPLTFCIVLIFRPKPFCTHRRWPTEEVKLAWCPFQRYLEVFLHD
jgi:hypothetical protein